MIKRRFQFSLRTLLIVLTLVAVVVATAANRPIVAIALASMLFALMDLAGWMLWLGSVFNLAELEGPKTTEQVRRERAKWKHD